MASGGPGLSAGGELGASSGGCEGITCLHGSACNVEPREELRASLGWMGFATSFPEPLPAAVCTPAPEGWSTASVLQASCLIRCCWSVPNLLLVPALASQPCQTAAGFILQQRASFHLCHPCGTKFFLRFQLSAWGEDQSLPYAVTAFPQRAGGEEEMRLTLVTGYLSSKGSSSIVPLPRRPYDLWCWGPTRCSSPGRSCVPSRSFPLCFLTRSQGADP